MRMKALCLGSVLGLAVLGCGDDDGGGSGVAGSKRINALTASEFRRVCQNVQQDFDRIGKALSEALCTAEGYAAADTQGDPSACEDTRKDCLEEPADTGDFELDCDDPPQEVEDDCDATVAEFEACTEAYARAVQNWAEDLTCESDAEDFESEPDLPEACKKLDDACGFAEEDSPDASDEEDP